MILLSLLPFWVFFLPYSEAISLVGRGLHTPLWGQFSWSLNEQVPGECFNKTPRGFSLPPTSYICYCEKEKLIFILLLLSHAWSLKKIISKEFVVMKIFRYLKSAKNRTMNSHIPSHGFSNYQDPVTFALYIPFCFPLLQTWCHFTPIFLNIQL